MSKPSLKLDTPSHFDHALAGSFTCVQAVGFSNHSNTARYRDVVGREQEVRVVEDVGDQPHEVEVHSFRDSKSLEKSHVVDLNPRAFQDVGPAVAEPPRWRDGEARSIEPTIDRALLRRQVAVADAIGKPTARVCVRWVTAGKLGREVLAGLQIGHPHKSPTADDLVRSAGYGTKEPAPMAKRQLPDCVKDHPVLREEIAVPNQRTVRIFQVQHIVHAM